MAFSSSTASSSSAAKKETVVVVDVVEEVVVAVDEVVVDVVVEAVVVLGVVVDLAVEAFFDVDVDDKVVRNFSVVSSLILLKATVLEAGVPSVVAAVADGDVGGIGVVVEELLVEFELIEFLNRFLLIKRTSFLTASEVVEAEDGFFESIAPAGDDENASFKGVGVVLLALNLP